MFVGNYVLDGDGYVLISKADVKSSNISKNVIKFLWTFRSTDGRRIRFTFNKFGLFWSSNHQCTLEIGDGANPGRQSRLAHFRGLAVPNDVISVSSSAWVELYDAALSGDSSTIPFLYQNLV